MRPMPVQIPRCLMQPEAWRFVGVASTVVGLVCYALSSSFNDLFGEWNSLKIFIYSVCSPIICLAVWSAKVWQHSPSPRFRAHMAFLVLTGGTVYSFFFDKVVQGKPDAYTLISCVAFVITSLSLSRQTHLGFEVELLCFFLGFLFTQLMKINKLLGIVGAGFSYLLIILPSLDAPQQSASLGFQDQGAIRGSSQQANNGSSVFMPQLRACIGALRQKNSNLIDLLLERVKEYQEAEDDSELVTDYNFVIDALTSGIIREGSRIIHDLHKTANLMVDGGFEKEFSYAYSSCRRECLEECLSRLLGLQANVYGNSEDLEWMEFEDLMIRRWIKAFNVALKILFPSERRLCDLVFFRFSSAADLCFVDVCRGATIWLLNFADAVANNSPSTWRLLKILDMCETLGDLIPDFESLFSDGYSVSLVKEAITIQNRLKEAISDVYMKLGNQVLPIRPALDVPDGGLHQITRNAMHYLRFACRSRQTLNVADGAGTSSSFSVQIVWIMELFERKLKAKSEIYEDPALRYVFMMNNRRYIEHNAIECELGTLVGDDWIRKNTAELRQNLEHYRRSSWNKVLEVLKLEHIESVAHNLTAESMKEKLNLFNTLFEEICSAQSTWFAFDELLREEIRKSLEDILLPAYGNFIWWFRNVLGEHAHKYIKYGRIDVKDRLDHLFRGSTG